MHIAIVIASHVVVITTTSFELKRLSSSFMAPAKANKVIRIKVPRHNSQRINAKLSTEVKHLARMKKVLVDTAQPSSRLTQAIVSHNSFF